MRHRRRRYARNPLTGMEWAIAGVGAVAAVAAIVSFYRDPFHGTPIKEGLVQVPDAQPRPPTQTEWDKHETTRTIVRATGAVSALAGLGLAATKPKGIGGWLVAGGLMLFGAYSLIAPPGGTSETKPALAMA
jgi:hypothetical protein